MTDKLQLLQGVRILAFTQFLLGPAAVQHLADMGADVVKVEPPGRGGYERNWSGGNTYPGGESAFFLLAHRNVRSVTLNLKTSEGVQAATELAAQSDVVVDNFRPGVLDRLGLGYDELRNHRPDLIYACASGYGSDGPYRDLPGQDLLLQAMSGLAAATGRAGEPPTAAGAAIVDGHAASLLAMGVLGALYRRAKTGEGDRVEVTMVQAALDIQVEPVVYHLNGGTVERPTEALASGFHQAPYGFYRTADGYVALSLSPVRTLADALGNPAELEPFHDPDLAFDQREEIHRTVAALLRDRSTDELLQLLRSHGVWCSPVNDYDATFEDPLVMASEPVHEFDHPRAGRVQTLRHPVRYGSGAPDTRQPPDLGEHTEQVLAEVGYTPEQITELREAGAT